MSRSTQLSFKQAPTFTKHFRTEHGGSLYKGKWSFLHPDNSTDVQSLAARTAQRFNVKLQQIANSGNHLHLIVRGKSRYGLQAFLRTFPALLARRITGAKKGSPQGRFWDALAYTRIVSWGQELVVLQRYLLRNDLEAVGFLRHSERTLSFAEALARRGLRLAGTKVRLAT